VLRQLRACSKAMGPRSCALAGTSGIVRISKILQVPAGGAGVASREFFPVERILA
jgi:hypothetical protein